MVEILEFWGKAQPSDANAGAQWHPLVFHNLDVAAVGAELLARHKKLNEHVARILNWSHEETRLVLPYLLSLHDIGKFSKKFQAKLPSRYPSCFGDDPRRLSTRFDHGSGGFYLFEAKPELFRLPTGSTPNEWDSLVSAVMGHHGAPPRTYPPDDTGVHLKREFGAAGIEAARLFADFARNLLQPPNRLVALDCETVRRASYAVAGFAVLSDWIGSNEQRWFPYRNPADFESAESYWPHARIQARKAVEEAGILPATPRSFVESSKLIGANNTPTPMQDWAQRVRLPAGPTLFIVEDETGSGKTEVAITLAHRLIADGRADGLYIALPTMATANAMFDRMRGNFRSLFSQDTTPSIALAHGASHLRPGFRSVNLPTGRLETPYAVGADDNTYTDTTASADCAAWIADDRRRTFLADIGVGTIDQALLSVLPNRHQSLRLFGLMRRVLILDEVHSYDPYMRREIAAQLEFQAALGGCAILLSATLPSSLARRFASAFARGVGATPATDDEAGDVTDYPLVTVRARDVHNREPVAAVRNRRRRVEVCWLRNPEEALHVVRRESCAGHAVLYIRNTVDDVFESHKALSDCGLAPMIFHARFALADRLARETEIVHTFGKHSSSVSRAGKLLIATQVVEQSLDLDFDVMVTDLAPIDLVIQRVGRLWRHARPERTGQPKLFVVGPETTNADDTWYSDPFPRASYVYPDHASLWLTAKALEQAESIDSPDGLRNLVESVYGPDAEDKIPECLVPSSLEAEGRAGADGAIAAQNVLHLCKGYVRDAGAWDADHRTATRLTDYPRVVLRLARIRDRCVVPYAQSSDQGDTGRAWRLSEVSVGANRVCGEVRTEQNDPSVRNAKESWQRYDADKILVILENFSERGFVLHGRALTNRGASEIGINYSRTSGLSFQSKAPT